jgi:hypothetical protein
VHVLVQAAVLLRIPTQRKKEGSDMASIPPIALPATSVVAGLQARLFLAECRSPAYASYNAALTKTSMQWMDIVLHNRVANYTLFGASGPNMQAVVQAPGQFAGFQSYPSLSSTVASNINAIMDIANNTADSRFSAYRAHVQLAIDVGNASPLADPSPGKLTFWRTAGSAAPGGSAKFFRTHNNHDYYYI